MLFPCIFKSLASVYAGYNLQQYINGAIQALLDQGNIKGAAAYVYKTIEHGVPEDFVIPYIGPCPQWVFDMADKDGNGEIDATEAENSTNWLAMVLPAIISASWIKSSEKQLSAFTFKCRI